MKQENLKGILLLLIGICLLSVGLYFLREQLEFISNSVETAGIVEEVSTHRSKGTTRYLPIVGYTVGGESYKVNGKASSSSSHDYEVGDAVRVRYEKNDPASAKLVSFSDMWLVSTLMLGLGSLFTIIGIYDIRIRLHNQKMRTELPRSGKKLQLTGRVEARETKSRTEFFVVADWLNPSDGKMIIFRSDKIKYDPTQFVKDKELTVWIDPQNPKKNHYIDISFLPEAS